MSRSQSLKPELQVLESWAKDFLLASHHISTFQEFLNFGIKKILMNHEFSGKTKKWKIINVIVNKPSKTPKEAQEQKCTYGTSVAIKIEEYILNNKNHTNPSRKEIEGDIIICHIPLIVLPDDEGSDGIGGYFLINAIERVLITQINNAYNIPIVTKTKPESKKNRIKSEEMFKFNSENLNSFVKQLYSNQIDIVEYELNIRSISESTKHSCASCIYLTRNGQLLMSNSKFKGKISVALLLKALGCITIIDFLWCVDDDEEIATWLYNSSIVYNNNYEALEMLSQTLIFNQKTVENIKLTPSDTFKFLLIEMFPHLGFLCTRSILILFIGSLLIKLFDAKRNPKLIDDRDHLKFKRFEPAGVLMFDLFEQITKKWIYSMNNYCLKEDTFALGIQDSFITKKILFCFATGTWGAHLSTYKRSGVSQPRLYTSWLGACSHLKRLSYPISKETHNQPIRQLHASHKNYICPCESPEGQTVGIVLNFALFTTTTQRIKSTFLIDIIQKWLDPIVIGQVYTNILFINGKPIGSLVKTIQEFVTYFKEARREGRFDGGLSRGMISIGILKKNIYIFCDEDRVTRLIKTDKYAGCINWYEGICNGELQWVDSFEQEYGLENFSFKNELSDATILSLSASVIPFIEHQPVPRTVYSTNMNKQAIGSLGPNQFLKSSTTLNIGRVQHGQIVSTHFSSFFGMDKYPTGINVIVAICPFNGFNQDDAIILNKATVDRGLFAADQYKSFIVTEEIVGDLYKKICVPKNKNNMYNYCLLDKNGIVKKGAWVKKGDVIVGQTCQKTKSQDVEDISTVIGRNEEGYVSNVIIYNLSGLKSVQLTVISNLQVVVGDKFASLYGQKGVVGKIVEPWDLPYMLDGTIPDIMMNPLALPSRMTIPTILEALFGLVAMETNEFFKVVPFENKNTFNEITEIMNNLGLNTEGTSLFRNPVNGKLMEPLFCGPMYYNRLAHFAEHKCYARSVGVVSKLTRQPTDGRSRQGGLRIGEMERDCIIGLNMPHVLMDRLFYSSDEFYIYICEKCHQNALNKNICLCGARGDEFIKRIKMSFVSNLVLNQMRAVGCRINYDVAD